MGGKELFATMKQINQMCKKMIMLAPTPFFADRGCHVRILNSYLRLQKEGYDILLITYPIGRNMRGVNIERVPSLPGYSKKDPGFSVFKPLLDLFLLFKLFRAYLQLKPEVIYCHLHEAALAGVIAKSIFGHVKIVFDSQGSLSGELKSNKTVKNSLLIGFLDSIEHFLLRKTDIIYTSTEALKRRYEKSVSKAKIRVALDYPDRSLFNPHIPALDPSVLALPNKKIVAYLGGLKSNKGIELLLRSIHFTPIYVHFLLMGYPLSEVRKRIEELGLENRITLTGPIPYDKSATYLKLADVAVSPKLISESGEANAKLYIYDAVGLPVVCFDTIDNRKILNNRGYFAKEGDIEDLARKISLACMEKNVT